VIAWKRKLIRESASKRKAQKTPSSLKAASLVKNPVRKLEAEVISSAVLPVEILLDALRLSLIVRNFLCFMRIASAALRTIASKSKP